MLFPDQYLSHKTSDTQLYTTLTKEKKQKKRTLLYAIQLQNMKEEWA